MHRQVISRPFHRNVAFGSNCEEHMFSSVGPKPRTLPTQAHVLKGAKQRLICSKNLLFRSPRRRDSKRGRHSGPSPLPASGYHWFEFGLAAQRRSAGWCRCLPDVTSSLAQPDRPRADKGSAEFIRSITPRKSFALIGIQLV